MARDEVPAEAVTDPQGALEVDARAGLANWKFVRFQLSANSANRSSLPTPRALIFSTVRQQPLTATLSPAFNPRPQTRERTIISMALDLGRMDSMRPVSSTMPVNMLQPRLDVAPATRAVKSKSPPSRRHCAPSKLMRPVNSRMPSPPTPVGASRPPTTIGA